MHRALTAVLASVTLSASLSSQDPSRFTPLDVFQLEFASDPQIAPDGGRVVYVRNGFDIMKDRGRSALWMIRADGSDHRALTDGTTGARSPRWSPDGDRLAYVSSADGSSQIWARWMDTGQETKLTTLTKSPGELAWSPDGRWIAFTMFVPGEPADPIASLPPKPEGADWGPPIRVVERLQYRADGAGYLENGFTHVFVLPAEGGTPRQITSGPYHHGGMPAWAPDGRHLLISANRLPDWEYVPQGSEVYEVSVADGAIRALTDRKGPDGSPRVSPDGRQIAYLGYDDREQGYQLTRLYVMNRDGSGQRLVTGSFDRDVGGIVWSADGRGLFFQYDEEGNTKVGYVTLDGRVQTVTGDVGGLSLGRPYPGGQFSVADGGAIAFTHSRPDHPADVAVVSAGQPVERLTRLNDDLFSHKRLGDVEELRYRSSFDDRPVQGWLVKPPDFDPARKYPLILEIHGGPFLNYGDRFAAEIQLYAAAGYVVLYTNPRGSTSYGEEFGNLIHHNYPGQDYDDLMSGVDAAIAKGYVDPEQLFVTGGSGGGVLSAWIVGHTDRFRAAVVQKPVINWFSFALNADGPSFFWRYWFPGYPWDHPDHYLKRSPIAYVGNVTTPTMLITGEEDYRTPISESEQFYTALKIRKVPAALVRVPDASHGIASKPSNLIAKIAYVLGWFERYRGDPADRAAGGEGTVGDRGPQP
jgi:acylaminoacyl-peptidase